MRGKIAKNLQTMRELIDNGNIKAEKNVHEKAMETCSEFEESTYKLFSRLDEDQHEEYIGKITGTWNNIDDMKIKIQNHISHDKSTTNFNTQDNNETTVAANWQRITQQSITISTQEQLDDNKHQLTEPYTTNNQKPAIQLNLTTSTAFGLIDHPTQAAWTTSRTE